MTNFNFQPQLDIAMKVIERELFTIQVPKSSEQEG